MLHKGVDCLCQHLDGEFSFTRTSANMYIYVHIHIHIYIHTYIRKYVRTYVRTYRHTYIHTHTPLYNGSGSGVGQTGVDDAQLQQKCARRRASLEDRQCRWPWHHLEMWPHFRLQVPGCWGIMCLWGPQIGGLQILGHFPLAGRREALKAGSWGSQSLIAIPLRVSSVP